MSIIGIGAMTEDGVVATREGYLPWGLHREDMAHFVGITKWCGVMVMGSATYKQMGMLPDRDNIVISNHLSKVFPDCEFQGGSSYPFYNIVERDKGLIQNLIASDSLKAVLEAGERMAIIGGPTIWKWTHFYSGYDEFYLTIIPNDLLAYSQREVRESRYKFPWGASMPSQPPEIPGMVATKLNRTSDGTKFVKYVREV